MALPRAPTPCAAIRNDFDRGVLAKSTNDGASHFSVWSPDGMRIAFRQGPMGEFKLQQTPVDRSAPPELVPAEGPSQSADSWSPDGRELLYTASGARQSFE